MLFPIRAVFNKFFLCGLRKRESRSRGNTELAFLEERKHGFLNNFGIKVNLTKAFVICHGAKYRICHLAHTTLVSKSLRESAMRFFKADKVQNAFADILRDLIGFYKRGHFIISIVFDNCNNLVRINVHKVVTDAVSCAVNRKRSCMRREFRESIVMHADAAIAQARVQFQNNLRRHFQITNGITARSRKANATVRHNRRNFDNRNSRRRDGPGTHKVAHLAQVSVNVMNASVIYRLAQARIGLVRHAERQCLRAGKRTVTAIARRGTRKKCHLEFLSCIMKSFCTRSYRKGNRLGVSCQSKSGNPENIAILNHFSRFCGTAFFTSNPIHAAKIVFLPP